jgi:SET domain-containing protein
LRIIGANTLILPFNTHHMKAAEYELPEPIDAAEADYLYVDSSAITGAGLGLFTAITIYPNEIISLFKGEVLTDLEAKQRAEHHQDDYFISLLDGTILDSQYVDCFAKYANDAEAFAGAEGKNNATITINEEGEVCLVASVEIAAGEEVYVGYGHRYWKNKALQNKEL